MANKFWGFSILILITFFGCDEKPTKSDIDYSNSQYVELDGENTKILLPQTFVKSSRYRLQRDIRKLREDTTGLFSLQRTLQMLEFDDAEIDLLVDTSSMFRFLMIVNYKYTPLSKEIGILLNKAISDYFQNIAIDNTNLLVEKEEASFKAYGSNLYFKFKFRFENLTDNHVYNMNFYLLTSKRQSYAITEITNLKNDLEKYIWTLKEI